MYLYKSMYFLLCFVAIFSPSYLFNDKTFSNRNKHVLSTFGEGIKVQNELIPAEINLNVDNNDDDDDDDDIFEGSDVPVATKPTKRPEPDDDDDEDDDDDDSPDGNNIPGNIKPTKQPKPDDDDDDDDDDGWDKPDNKPTDAPTPEPGGPVDCSVTGKFYPHERDCNKYYWCYGGRANIHQCGPGTVWDPSFNGCNWPDAARRTNCN